MPDKAAEGLIRPDLGVKETTESDNIVRWDGERLYVEHDIYHNGQLVHRRYRRNVTAAVASALAALADGAVKPGEDPSR